MSDQFRTLCIKGLSLIWGKRLTFEKSVYLKNLEYKKDIFVQVYSILCYGLFTCILLRKTLHCFHGVSMTVSKIVFYHYDSYDNKLFFIIISHKIIDFLMLTLFTFRKLIHILSILTCLLEFWEFSKSNSLL